MLGLHPTPYTHLFTSWRGITISDFSFFFFSFLFYSLKTMTPMLSLPEPMLSLSLSLSLVLLLSLSGRPTCFANAISTSQHWPPTAPRFGYSRLFQIWMCGEVFIRLKIPQDFLHFYLLSFIQYIKQVGLELNFRFRKRTKRLNFDWCFTKRIGRVTKIQRDPEIRV
jgi:hypothetical protein